MRRLTLATAGITLAIMLAAPRAATAGMGEVIDGIIGLTGPQMIGVPIDCELNLRTRQRACYVAGFRVPPRPLDDNFLRDRQIWLAIGAALYTSTGKNSEMRPFSWGDAGMVAFEPTVNVRSYERTSRTNMRFAVEHGAGPSALYLFGDGFTPFVKGGIKVRPVSVVWRNIGGGAWDFGVAYNIRFFPNAFTAAEFGKPGPTTHGGREFAHGFTLTIGH